MHCYMVEDVVDLAIAEGEGIAQHAEENARTKWTAMEVGTYLELHRTDIANDLRPVAARG